MFPNKIHLVISSIRYGAVLLFSLLLGASGSDDFITKYEKYNSVCRRMGYQDKRCEERGRVNLLELLRLYVKEMRLNF